MTRRSAMSGRERILAALRRQPVDRIPFVPLIDPYTLRDMPADIAGEGELTSFSPRRVTAAGRALGCDLMVRHVMATAPLRANATHLESLGSFGPPVEAKSELRGAELHESLNTPVGTLTAAWKFTDRVGIIPHFIEYPVNSYEEMKVFHYAVHHLITTPPEPRFDSFLAIDEAIGDDGIATASMSNSPLMFLIEMGWGLENTYLLLHDHREEVEDVLDKLHASLRRYAMALAESPAQVVIQYENTSSTLLSPTVFRRYCLPYINEYADIITGAGKVFLVHMCGKLSRLADDVSTGHYSGVCDIAPEPTGDLTLDRAAACFPDKVVVGGIDATTFISPNAGFVRAEVSALIERIKPLRGVLLGSGDVAPRGTLPENIRLIGSLVRSLGAYE